MGISVVGLSALIYLVDEMISIALIDGNDSGTYSVPGLSGIEQLLAGFFVEEPLGTATTYNAAELGWLLVPQSINPTTGWYVAPGQIIDPAGEDWSNDTILWLYLRN